MNCPLIRRRDLKECRLQKSLRREEPKREQERKKDRGRAEGHRPHFLLFFSFDVSQTQAERSLTEPSGGASSLPRDRQKSNHLRPLLENAGGRGSRHPSLSLLLFIFLKSLSRSRATERERGKKKLRREATRAGLRGLGPGRRGLQQSLSVKGLLFLNVSRRGRGRLVPTRLDACRRRERRVSLHSHFIS